MTESKLGRYEFCLNGEWLEKQVLIDSFNKNKNFDLIEKSIDELLEELNRETKWRRKPHKKQV